MCRKVLFVKIVRSNRYLEITVISVTKRPIFKTTIVSSGLLLIALTLFERLWTDSRGICALLLGIGGLGYVVTLLWTIIFWIEKRHYRIAYMPFAISLTTGIIAYCIPLNRVCDKAEFALLHNKYDKMAQMVLQSRGNNEVYNYKLPHRYHKLSVGGGDAVVMQNKDTRAVMFYTYRNAGREKGFVKLAQGQNIDECLRSRYSEIDTVRPMGNNWYYVTAE